MLFIPVLHRCRPQEPIISGLGSLHEDALGWPPPWRVMRFATACPIVCLCVLPPRRRRRVAIWRREGPDGPGAGPWTSADRCQGLDPSRPLAAPQGGRRISSVPRRRQGRGPGAPAHRAALPRRSRREGGLEGRRRDRRRGAAPLQGGRARAAGQGDHEGRVEEGRVDPPGAAGGQRRKGEGRGHAPRPRQVARQADPGAGAHAPDRGRPEWLAKRQRDNGGFAQTLSGLNGAVCQTALQASPGSPAERPEARSLQGPCPARRRLRDRERRQDHVVRRQGVAHRRRQPQPVDVGAGARRHLPRGAAGPTAPTPRCSASSSAWAPNWRSARRTPAGWGHGPGGPNPLGYVELNILSGLALCGMGMAHQLAVDPPEEVLDRAEKYLEASSSGDGGVGYFGPARPGRPGQHRSHGGVLARLPDAGAGQACLVPQDGEVDRAQRGRRARRPRESHDPHLPRRRGGERAGQAGREEVLGGCAAATSSWRAHLRRLLPAAAPWRETLRRARTATSASATLGRPRPGRSSSPASPRRSVAPACPTGWFSRPCASRASRSPPCTPVA